jgi:branched-chain amino acid aminotransferase
MSVVWFNGSFVEGPVPLDPADRGLTLGDGVFETIAVRGGKAIWLDEHVVRMAAAAAELGIGFDDAKLRAGVADVLAKNTFVAAALRITLTRGVVVPRALTGVGRAPSLLISLSAFDLTSQPASIRLAVSSIRQNETAPSSRLKTLSYIDGIAAAREVTARADDALLLNTAGHVACTTIGNLFLLRGDQLITPRRDQGILCGITRAKLLQYAHELELRPVEAVVALTDVFAAEAVFRTNSLRLVTSVTLLDGTPLGTRSIENIKHKLETIVGRI